MLTESSQLATAVREHVLHLLEDTGLDSLVSRETLQHALEDLELGLGQLLADVERARRQGVPLGDAVHAHEQYPILAKFHGRLHDAFVLELPAELVSILRRLRFRPPAGWGRTLMDELCVVARSAAATPAERAFARLFVFEEIRLHLGLTAYRTQGVFEGVGGCRCDLDQIAARQLDALLAIPLEVDARVPHRPFLAALAAATVHLTRHVDDLRALRATVKEFDEDVRAHAALELLLRNADPVDATVLRHRFDRASHQQRIPLARLAMEHPLVLAGHTEDSLYQRSSRALRKLKKSPSELCRPTKPLTLTELALEWEDAHA